MYKFLIFNCEMCLLKGIEWDITDAPMPPDVCKHPESALAGGVEHRRIEDKYSVPQWCPLRDGEATLSLAEGV